MLATVCEIPSDLDSLSQETLRVWEPSPQNASHCREMEEPCWSHTVGTLYAVKSNQILIVLTVVTITVEMFEHNAKIIFKKS